jgi:hypothetical protein
LYYFLEKPYFTKRDKKIVEENSLKAKMNVPILFGSITLLILLVTFIVYQSDVSFFTLKEPLSPQTNNNKTVSLLSNPKTSLTFQAKHNNLGVLIFNLSHSSIPNKKFIPQVVELQMKEIHEATWYTTSDYTINHASDQLPDTFGFPLIQNAMGKTYTVTIKDKVPTSTEYVTLDNNNAGVYFVDKKQLITNPKNFFYFMENKFFVVASNLQAQYIVITLFPFLVFSMFLLTTRKKYQNLRTT